MRQQNKKLLSQLSEPDTDFLIGQSNNENRIEDRSVTADGNIAFNDTNKLTHVSGSQVDMHTLEKNVANKVRNGVDSVMIKFETRVQDAMLTSIENLVIPNVELAMKSVIASSGRGVDSALAYSGRRKFSVIAEDLQMTA